MPQWLTLDLPLLLGVVLLFAASIVLAAAETSLLRVSRVRVAVMAEQGEAGSKRLLALLDDLPRVLNTVLLCVLLCQVGAATATGVLAERHFGNVGVTVASVALTILMFVYAEAIPKTVSVRAPVRAAIVLAPFIALLAWVLRPIVTVLVAFADLQAPGEGIAAHRAFSEEELRRLAAEAADAGSIDPHDLELIERAFRLGDIRVTEVMVPRPDVHSVPKTATVRVALELALSTGHRRLPVYDGDPDHIVGLVRMRDLARAVAGGAETALHELMVPILVVPESKPVIALLREMQAATTHVAIVVDEHGSTVGLVTIEDVVHELVGAVSDEGEDVRPPVLQTADGVWEIEGGATLRDVADALDVSLPEGSYTTAAGLVLAEAGAIPRPGTSLEIAGLRWTVVEATRRRVRLLRVER